MDRFQVRAKVVVVVGIFGVVVDVDVVDVNVEVQFVVLVVDVAKGRECFSFQRAQKVVPVVVVVFDVVVDAVEVKIEVVVVANGRQSISFKRAEM